MPGYFQHLSLSRLIPILMVIGLLSFNTGCNESTETNSTSEPDSESPTRQAIELNETDSQLPTGNIDNLSPADSIKIATNLAEKKPVFFPQIPTRDTFDTLLTLEDPPFRLKTEYYTSDSEGLKYGVRGPDGVFQLYVFLMYNGRVQLLEGNDILTDQVFTIEDFAPYVNSDFQQQGLIAGWDFYGYQPETKSIAMRAKLVIPQSNRYYEFLVAVYTNNEVEFIKLQTNEDV